MRGQREGQLACYSANPSPGTSPVVVPVREVLKVGWMNSPKMALAIVTATGFDEALVQREIVSDAVSPVLVLFKEYVNYDSSESLR